ncbi:MAG: bifunctional DNA-formamidopyrimidine glycosylase/DNA-(apurinic or apyrimidinic site) lyase [Magnetococcales bacterium]|nr:bifunctional DNA-formamidopyrimidine glycosylase/DNA-(apurinic or apyrimidinic site) lyase [Magnetococcales bacterium]
MPELPEVETIRRGVAERIVGRTIQALAVRRTDLRWPVPEVTLRQKVIGKTILKVERRGKYVLLACPNGFILLHFGMTGGVRWVRPDAPWEKHDHVALELDNNLTLRFYDPRRFGALLWVDPPWESHPLLANLGVEPLGEAFHGDHLFAASRNRRVSVKGFLMDAKMVVGVGNIYANEALFLAGLHPERPVDQLTLDDCQRLAQTVRELLSAAIAKGGTTFRDYRDSDGNMGYFKMDLHVYQRQGEPCFTCNSPIQMTRSHGRSTFHCPACQKPVRSPWP